VKKQWIAVFYAPGNEPEDSSEAPSIEGVRIGKISEARMRQILGSVYREQADIDTLIEDGEFTSLWNIQFYREDKAADLSFMESKRAA
jgi:hypothetical protein